MLNLFKYHSTLPVAYRPQRALGGGRLQSGPRGGGTEIMKLYIYIYILPATYCLSADLFQSLQIRRTIVRYIAHCMLPMFVAFFSVTMIFVLVLHWRGMR